MAKRFSPLPDSGAPNFQRYNIKSKVFESFMGGISAQDVEFSKDGQWVTYSSYPEGILWRSKLDGSEKLQLSSSPIYASLPRWSVDEKTIVFYDVQPGKTTRIYEVPAVGGAPRPLLPDDTGPQADPSWSPDGKSLVFGGTGGGGPTMIRILNLNARQIETVPGSDGLFSPRWSPDARYLVAMRGDSTWSLSLRRQNAEVGDACARHRRLSLLVCTMAGIFISSGSVTSRMWSGWPFPTEKSSRFGA